jgi:predicted  nucleic acid-binding Zn-ribbon protein
MKFTPQYEYASERDVYDGLPIEAQDAISRIVKSEALIRRSARAMGQINDTTDDKQQIQHFAEQLRDAESALDGAMTDFQEFVVPHLPKEFQ